MKLNCGEGRTLPGTFSKGAGEDRHLVLMNALFSSLSFLSLLEPFSRRRHGSNRIHLLSSAHVILVSSPSAFLSQDFPLLINLPHLFLCLTPRTDLVCFERWIPHN